MTKQHRKRWRDREWTRKSDRVSAPVGKCKCVCVCVGVGVCVCVGVGVWVGVCVWEREIERERERERGREADFVRRREIKRGRLKLVDFLKSQISTNVEKVLLF